MFYDCSSARMMYRMSATKYSAIRVNEAWYCLNLMYIK